MATHIMHQTLAVCACYGASSQALAAHLHAVGQTYLAHLSNTLNLSSAPTGSAVDSYSHTQMPRGSCIFSRWKDCKQCEQLGSSWAPAATDSTQQFEMAESDAAAQGLSDRTAAQAVSAHAEDQHCDSARQWQDAIDDGRSAPKANSHSGRHQQQVSRRSHTLRC